MDFSRVVQIAKKKYPTSGKKFDYGTAGFRNRAEDLDFVMFRMGLLAVLRSCDKKAAVAVMITASHNPIEDNGVKLIDPMGEMLAIQWESHATDVTRASDEDVVLVLQEIIKEHSIETNEKPLIFIGRDTRPSSERLKDGVVCGVEALGGTAKDFGIVSTPILHFIVASHNSGGRYGSPTSEGYFKKLSEAFIALRQLGNGENGNFKPKLYFDGANGVGALVMQEFLSYLGGTIDMEMFNKGEGVLNSMCGSDYVKTVQAWPNGVPKTPFTRCFSVDGDADRILYSYLDEREEIHMLDGDKIGTLLAAHLKKLLDKEGINLRLGLVQTAYANGASTDYINKELSIPVTCTKTGVKHLHAAALEYDIGVYFESNGHGTVVFSENARRTIQNQSRELNNIMRLINETVGDAISDMLFIETILHSNGWSIQEWDNVYTDLAYCLTKISVADRSAIQTANAERTCIAPQGLQAKIDELVNNYDKGRSFVRPSGTEDNVRIYAEAKTKLEADRLASQVAALTYDMAGGIGERPQVIL